jgi:catalase
VLAFRRGWPCGAVQKEMRMTTPQPQPTTNDAGIPVASDEFSLTVGPDGPILLQDHYLIEQMANFNRERIPERQPHAKGHGAFGYFEVTGDVSAYTTAAVFQPGARTDTAIRFSIVRGSAATPTPCGTRAGSRSSSIQHTATWTLSATTRRSSSPATR